MNKLLSTLIIAMTSVGGLLLTIGSAAALDQQKTYTVGSSFDFNPNGALVPTTGQAYKNDTATVMQMCKLQGYNQGQVVATNYFRSPSDNQVIFYKGNTWAAEQSTNSNKTFITSYTCSVPVIVKQKISTCDDLQNIRFDLAGNYTLVNDIDCSSTASFIPIANPKAPFTGVLKGMNYTIKNLTIKAGTHKETTFYGGIFGGSHSSSTSDVYDTVALFNVTSGATFSNIKFDNFKVLGGSESAFLVNSAYATNFDKIFINNSAIGDLGDPTSGLYSLRAMISYLDAKSTLSNSAIIAQNPEGITAMDFIFLVGVADGKVSNSYAISPNTYCLFCDTNSFSPENYDNVFASSINTTGASPKQINFVFSKGQLINITNKTTMFSKATYTGFDFDKVWTINEGKSYPTLRWLDEPAGGAVRVTLNINTQKVSARIISSPKGIDCQKSAAGAVSGTCVATFPAGTSVTLNENVQKYNYINWGVKGCDSKDSKCSVKLNSNAEEVINVLVSNDK